MSELLNSYSRSPQKNTGGKAKFETKEVNSVQPGFTPTSAQAKPTKISFQTVSDFSVGYKGKLFNENKGKFSTAADYSKQSLAGLAGVGYNALLLLSVEGKAAQITAKGIGIGLGTTSLMLGDGYSFGKAAGISTLAFALKGSNNGYDWFRDPVKDVVNQIGVSTLEARIAGGAITQWQTYGRAVYKNVYHTIPSINPFGIIPGHHVGFSALPIQWVEAGLTKAAAKNTFGFALGKKPYEPYYTGQSAIDQLHLEKSTFSLSSPNISVSNYIKPSNIDGAISMRSTLPSGTVMDSMDPNPNRIISRPPPKEKTEEEKLIGFLADFDKVAPQNRWERRWDEIFRPQLYADYNKAVKEIAKKAIVKTSAVPKVTELGNWFQNIIFGDIEKSIKNLSAGIEGSNKLSNGIDYNDELIQKIAKFKTDLENAGGKLIIEPNGSFIIKKPTDEQDKIYAAKIRTSWRLPKTDAEKNAAIREEEANNAKTKNNVPLIREAVKNANKSAEDLTLRKFIKKTYNVDVFNQRLGSNLENIQKLTGRSKAQVIDAFYAQYPQYQTEDYKVEKQLDKLPQTWQKQQFLGKYNNYHGLNRKGRSQFTYDPRNGLRRIITN
jgi:hypothetical protein